ncbi:MAG: hypothetical protein KAG61_14245 [Bacteriovoracaceae bacterium]|nr:hypothetical protein [Bacteriovoracaceae bacterium]
MRYFFTLTLVSLLIFSCSKPNNPETVLREYVGYRFQKDQMKSKLLEMTAEQLKQSIEVMTEDEFIQFTDIAKYHKKGLRILTKKCTEIECYITYILKYDITNKATKSYSAEIRKVAKLTSVAGVWKVSDVNNIKTFYDSKVPIEVRAE